MILATAEMVRYYAEASVAVVPSVYEGFGLPAGEAMACGVPVISTTGGALPEVVGECEKIIEELKELTARDMAAFDIFMTAWRLPSDSDAEKAAKEAEKAAEKARKLAELNLRRGKVNNAWGQLELEFAQAGGIKGVKGLNRDEAVDLLENSLGCFGSGNNQQGKAHGGQRKICWFHVASRK